MLATLPKVRGLGVATLVGTHSLTSNNVGRLTVAERGAFCALDHVMSLNIENSKYLGIDCLRLPSSLMP